VRSKRGGKVLTLTLTLTLTLKVRSKRGGKVSVVAAISIAGGYTDDQDYGDICMYTGAGANDGKHTKEQIGDQSFGDGSGDNAALARNCDLGVPVTGRIPPKEDN